MKTDYYHIFYHKRYMINTRLYNWLVKYKVFKPNTLDFEKRLEEFFKL